MLTVYPNLAGGYAATHTHRDIVRASTDPCPLKAAYKVLSWAASTAEHPPSDFQCRDSCG